MGQQSARFKFAKRAKQLRIKRGWTQKELALRAGVSERYLQKIEGKNPPDVTLDVMINFAVALDLELWKIVR